MTEGRYAIQSAQGDSEMIRAIYCENGHYIGPVPQESDYMIRRGRVDRYFEEEARREFAHPAWPTSLI
jgi:hypothetical protein